MFAAPFPDKSFHLPALVLLEQGGGCPGESIVKDFGLHKLIREKQWCLPCTYMTWKAGHKPKKCTLLLI